MALQLRIISEHRRQLGGRSTLVLEADGATIGRASDNQWVLPDPHRYISAHHARVHYRDHLYILEDVSTNGVYVNDETRPVGPSGAHVLQNGDLIRMGEYQFIAMVEPDRTAPPATNSPLPTTAPAPAPMPTPGASSIQVLALPSQVDVVREVVAGGDSDLNASLNLDDLLGTDAEAALQAADASEGAGITGTPVRLSALLADAEDSPTERRALALRIARLARAAERAQERHAQAQPQSSDLASGLAAFCKGAGIELANLPAEAQNTLLQLAGLLCREALLGLKDLGRVLHDGAAGLGIPLPDEVQNVDDPRSSLAHMTVDEALTRLLTQHQGLQLDGIQWLRDTVETARRHHQAILAAVKPKG